MSSHEADGGLQHKVRRNTHMTQLRITMIRQLIPYTPNLTHRHTRSKKKKKKPLRCWADMAGVDKCQCLLDCDLLYTFLSLWSLRPHHAMVMMCFRNKKCAKNLKIKYSGRISPQKKRMNEFKPVTYKSLYSAQWHFHDNYIHSPPSLITIMRLDILFKKKNKKNNYILIGDTTSCGAETEQWDFLLAIGGGIENRAIKSDTFAVFA